LIGKTDSIKFKTTFHRRYLLITAGFTLVLLFIWTQFIIKRKKRK